MRRLFSLLTLALAVVATGACNMAPAVDTAADTAAINALRTEFMTAFNANDAARVANLYTDDGISMPGHQPSVVGKAAVLAHDQEFFGQVAAHIELKSDELKLLGDWAFDRGTYTMTITPKAAGAAPMTDQGRYLVLVQRQADKSWKLSRDIDNSTLPMPMPPPPAKGKGK